jgi:hypothetical protein
MEDNMVEKSVLVLTGEGGELYAIPQEALKQYLATDEQRAAIEEVWGGDDVSGYSMYQNYLAGQAVSQRHSDLHQRREEIRHKADYAQMSAAADAGGGEPGRSGAEADPIRKGFFTGVLTTLRLMPAKATK